MRDEEPHMPLNVRESRLLSSLGPAVSSETGACCSLPGGLFPTPLWETGSQSSLLGTELGLEGL